MNHSKKSTASNFSSIESEDDGIPIPEVGSWAENKYKLVKLYDELFLTGMSSSWDQLVYIDLFAGSGKAKVRNTNRIFAGSPLLALKLQKKFSRYIFCEDNKDLLDALERRVNTEYPGVDAHYIYGDCNQKINDILALIPMHSRTNKVLTFCFIDPFSLNIEFNTIKTLCKGRFVDFLILLALSMDGTRNESIYVDPKSEKIEKFLGLQNWREKWKRAKAEGISFRTYLATEYAKQMVGLRYMEESITQMLEVRSDERNLPLYHLAFFSRNPLGYRFWKQVKKYATRQPSLFEM